MNERISSDQLSPRIKRLRRAQVILAVNGMGAFLIALIGGAIESRALAWIGIGAFLLSLVGLLGAGVISWISPTHTDR